MQPQAPFTNPVPTNNELPKKRNSRKIAGIILLVAPTALIIITLVMYAVMNIAFASSGSNGDLFRDRSPATSIMNIFLFIFGTIGFLSWLPALIIGIVLLATQKKQ